MKRLLGCLLSTRRSSEAVEKVNEPQLTAVHRGGAENQGVARKS